VIEWRGDAGGRTSSLYYAFWSSTAADFYPQFLFRVHPGDSVRLSMTLTRGRWHMVAADPDAGHRQAVVVAGGGAGFEEANWVQENTTKSGAATQLPYPDLGPVRFARVEASSATPAARSMNLVWMSTGDGTFGPGRYRGGSFVVRPAHPSGLDVRYDEVMRDLAYAGAAYRHDLLDWTGSTRVSDIRFASESYAGTLKLGARRLLAMNWPSTARVLVHRLATAILNTSTLVLGFPAQLMRRLHQARASYAHSATLIQRAALRLTSRLHMPNGSYSGAALAYYVRTHSN
jgi:hypothetical protein